MRTCSDQRAVERQEHGIAVLPYASTRRVQLRPNRSRVLLYRRGNELLLQEQRLLLPPSRVRLERKAIVLEAPDDCGETVDNGRGIPIKRPQLSINIERIDQLCLRRRTCGQGIEAHHQRDGALVQLAPGSRLFETGQRRPAAIPRLRRTA